MIKFFNISNALFNPNNGARFFIFVTAIFYGFIPLLYGFFFSGGEQFFLLSGITALSAFSIWMGWHVNIFDRRFKEYSARFKFSRKKVMLFTWGVFGLFVVFSLATAPAIPLISALQGIDANELSAQRGAFFKGREGFWIILLYFNTFLVNSIVPYSIILLYDEKSPKRHIFAFLFFVFCISFMQKSLFLNLLLPILVFLSMKKSIGNRLLFILAVFSIGFLLMFTSLSLQGDENIFSASDENYLSARYIPGGTLDYFLWRSAAVPVFTAADTLVVYSEQFNQTPLLGATSSFLSGIFGIDRINIERYVFEYQFGSWNEIANSNAYFAVDAFVNFGWLGVLMFSFFVGQMFRWFRLSLDVPFKSLWLLFAFSLFSASLIGTLLSNGFLFLFFHSLFIRLNK